MNPRGITNNNPLNIRHSANRWQGASEKQTDRSFVQFNSMAYGYRAAWKVLQSYYNRFTHQSQPFTVRNIISRWAPPSENDTEAYIRTVLSLSGLGGKENLLPPENVDSYGRLSRLLEAMTCVECGIAPKRVDTEAISNGYRLAFPENVEELDDWLSAKDEYWDW
ncbi:MAG: structural protein P5 [Bacteroidaceae bacterium]|nr:structural protein P5 [Bacteroidaceae bacterium]